MTTKNVLLEKRLLAPQGLSDLKTRAKHPLSPHWFLFLAFWVLATGILALIVMDEPLRRSTYWHGQVNWFLALNHYLTTAPSYLWANLTMLGDASVLIPIVAILTIRRRQVWMAILASIPFAALTSVIFKKMAAMPRPAAVIDPQSFNVIGEVLTGYNSLPSGHTITIFSAGIAMLSTLVPRPQNFRDYRYIGLGVLITAIVGLSRIAVGAHWPLDIMLGASLGGLAGLSGSALTLHKQWQGPTGNRSSKIATVIFTAFSISLLYRIINESHPDPILWVAMFSGLLTIAHLLFEDIFLIKITVLTHQPS